MLLVVIDGLGARESQLPFLDDLRARGASTTARTSYPSISRPNYVTILTGVPPRDSGVRTNSVHEPPGVDTIMDRAHAAGLRAVTASDYGSLASLFRRPGEGSDNSAFDDVERDDSLDELRATTARLTRGDAALVAILALDVDRAGHASGVGDDYRAAAVAVDRMLRAVVSNLDLSRDAVVVTADHGHVAPGGHGGLEAEVMNVPLVLAGAGVVPGAVARDARLVDVSPTIAALLGIAAPGHAEGRALVELLRLPPEDAARRAAADDARAAAVTAIADAAATADDDARPVPWRLAAAAVTWIGAAALALALRRRGVIALRWTASLGVTGFVAILVAETIILRGQPSPSYVPSLARAELRGALGAIAAIALHVAVTVIAVRRAPDRVAAATGSAIVGLAVALGSVAIVAAWQSPPYVDVPTPFWIVAMPALYLAAATAAAAVAIALGVVAAVAARTKRRETARAAL